MGEYPETTRCVVSGANEYVERGGKVKEWAEMPDVAEATEMAKSSFALLMLLSLRGERGDEQADELFGRVVEQMPLMAAKTTLMAAFAECIHLGRKVYDDPREYEMRLVLQLLKIDVKDGIFTPEEVEELKKFTEGRLKDGGEQAAE
jgi:hypothetical protein